MPFLSDQVWRVFQRNVPVVFIFHDGTEEEIKSIIVQDSESSKGEENLKEFAWMYLDVKHEAYRSYAKSLGLNGDVYPSAVGFTKDFQSRFLYEGTFTTETLLAWARDKLVVPCEMSKYVRRF